MTKSKKKTLIVAKNMNSSKRKINLLDLHINRKKYDILGMKSKAERGLPGISRAKSLNKRKRTLLQEYKLKNKNNLFYDKRIGERNTAMTAEDKIIARFAAERMKLHSKKSVYNLGEDEELTHRGQSLTDIEKFDDPKSEDENEDDGDDENGRLDSEFVENAHFGGGLFKKANEPKSHKDLIDQLIAESIKRKAEKQKIKQHTYEMVEKLDSDWKELLPIVTESKKKKLEEHSENKKDDEFASYDVFSKKLKFEARGKPSDKLKSEEEIVQQEKERLEQLEKERIIRMLGETPKIEKSYKHRSADDIDDGFDYENKSEEVLTYNNGVLNMNNDDQNDSEIKFNEDMKSSDENETDDSEISENISSDTESEISGKNEESNESIIKENDKSNVLGGQKSFDNEEHKNLSQSNKTENENSIEKNEVEENVKENDKHLKIVENGTEATILPFTFKIPNNYEEFESLLNNQSFDHQSLILERMIKCHHPSLKENCKDDLNILFPYLLQYILNCASKNDSKINSFKALDKLSPWLFDLLQWNTPSCSSEIKKVIAQDFKNFCKNPKIYPPLNTLVCFKLVSLLFPTSDYRHPVVTPTLVFMKKILFQSEIKSSVDLSIGLFVATLILEYCSFSKRFSPEVMNFLYCVLRLAHPKDSNISIRMPLEVQTFDHINLIVCEKSGETKSSSLSTRNLILPDNSDRFKINAISLVLTLLSSFCDFWTEDQPAILILDPFIPLLDSKLFADCLKNQIDEVLEKIMKFKNGNLKKLVLQKKKPKPLRFYEPKIEEVYNLKRHQPMGKKKRERAKLLHKYKQEMKGALREIRRDRAFLCKIKYKETIRNDMERKKKVQEILGLAAEQQGDLRKIQRRKK